MGPLEVWLSQICLEMIPQDERLQAREDPRCTRVYICWWEVHRPVQLNIPRVLEPNEPAPSIDEVVDSEGDALGEGRLPKGGEDLDKESQGTEIGVEEKGQGITGTSIRGAFIGVDTNIVDMSIVVGSGCRKWGQADGHTDWRGRVGGGRWSYRGIKGRRWSCRGTKGRSDTCFIG